MKKIFFFLIISFYSIKSLEIQVLLTRTTYEEILSEVETVTNKILKMPLIENKKNLIPINNIDVIYMISILYNYMRTAFEKLYIQHNDTNIEILANDLVNIYKKNKDEYIIQNNCKSRIFDFLYYYGYPNIDDNYLTFEKKVESIGSYISDNILNSCINVKKKDDHYSCINTQFDYLYDILPDNYKKEFKKINEIYEIYNITYQRTKETTREKTKIEEIINNTFDVFFNSELYLNDSNISKNIENYFGEIKNECLKFNYFKINIKDCITPKIISIYNLIPYDLKETSEWIINEFFMNNSKININKLIKIFSSLKIKKISFIKSRLLTEASTSYSTGLCRWFSFWFCFDEEYCN